MPIYLRNFYYKKLIDAKKEEQGEIDKINKKNKDLFKKPA
jgi:hypothetical protein